jgi:uncharacterized membrane protein
MKRYFIAGLLVWIPLGITLWILNLILVTADQTLSLLPPDLRPEVLLGLSLPGAGLVVTLLVILITGVLAANYVGRKLLAVGEQLLVKIPVVKSIYGGVKQVSDTLFSSEGQAFRQAVLVEYPRRGSWTVGFQTGVPTGEVAAAIGSDHISVYVPTTPNPTSGFFLIVPKSEVKPLEMSVDNALKYIISMGVVGPEQAVKPAGSESAKPSNKS